MEAVEYGELDWSDYSTMLGIVLLVHGVQFVVASIYFFLLAETFLLCIDVGFFHYVAGPQYPFDVTPPFVLEGL